jgi:hypothetical protein
MDLTFDLIAYTRTLLQGSATLYGGDLVFHHVREHWVRI